MPLISREGRAKALKRLREEIDKSLKGKSFSSITSSYEVLKTHLGIRKLLTRVGVNREDFSIAFSLSDVSGIEHFVAKI